MSTSYQHVFLTIWNHPLFLFGGLNMLKTNPIGFFLSRSPQLSLLRSPVKFSRDRNWWSCCISWCSKAAPSCGPSEASVGTMAPCHGVGMMGWARLGISSWCILMSTFKWKKLEMVRWSRCLFFWWCMVGNRDFRGGFLVSLEGWFDLQIPRWCILIMEWWHEMLTH